MFRTCARLLFRTCARLPRPAVLQRAHGKPRAPHPARVTVDAAAGRWRPGSNPGQRAPRRAAVVMLARTAFTAAGYGDITARSPRTC
ncbi:hypothetical protein [Streptomyces triticisoli]|uniref:hypothetical protein n=1 Tax=Streptomyces triticisoli TaxID=2182797 RepID=UPI000DDB0B84|nr:hypothetical protein [Streptomyces triticisoli]